MTGALGRLGVEAGERALFLWAGLCLALVGAASMALLNSSEALFLKRVGVSYLPLALLANSVLLLATTAALGRGAARVDRPRWLPRVLLLLGVMPLPFAFLGGLDRTAELGALVLVARQVLGLGELAFWLGLADLVTGRQGKRLFAPLTAGFTVGSIAGSFASGWLAQRLGIETLLLISSAALWGAAFAAVRLRASRPRRLDRAVGAGAVGLPDAPASLGSLLRESALFRLLAVAILCGGALNPVLYFQYSWAANAATDDPSELLSLFAQVRGWFNVALLVTQLGLSGRLYQRVGVPLSLALWPATYLLGLGWLAVQLGLRAGVTGLTVTRVAEDGVGHPGLRVLFNLFPERARARATALLGGPVIRLGGALGSGAVLVALAVSGPEHIGLGAIPLSGLWLLAALALWRAYPGLLLQASAERSLAGADADKALLLDRGTLRALAPRLVDPDIRVCRAAIDLMRDADPDLAAELLAEAVESAPEAHCALLVDALHRLVEPLPSGRVQSPRAGAALGRLLTGEKRPLPPEQRSDLLQVYARLTGSADGDGAVALESTDLLVRALGDREAAVRLGAVAELHRRRRPPPGAPDLDGALADALAARDFLVRRAARKELRAMLLSTTPDPVWHARLAELTGHLPQRADRAETAEALAEVARRHDGAASARAAEVVGWIDDSDPRVRAAVLAFAGHAGVSEQAPRLVEALASREAVESDAAREGLVALGAEAAQPLLLECEFGAPSHRDVVVAVLRELEIEPAAFDGLYRQQLERGRTALGLLAALGPEHPARLVVRRLEERVGECAGALLALLAVRHDDERIAELEWRFRRVSDDRQRDILVEAIESLLSLEERAELLPLLDFGERSGQEDPASGDAEPRTPDAGAALEALQRDPDALTRRLAAAHVRAELERERGISDAAGVLDPMQIAVRLQEVTVFDRLSTQQLVRLAEVLVEEHHEAEAPLFSEGDEGRRLYIVLEGEVQLSKAGQPLERCGANSFFGELSALDGVPRAVSAHACGPVRLLALDRQDLLSLMYDVPALGIGLSQFLSLRVRSLQERVPGADAQPTSGERSSPG